MIQNLILNASYEIDGQSGDGNEISSNSLEVYVDGVLRSNILLNGFRIEDTINNSIDKLAFTVKKVRSTDFYPQVNSRVEVYNNSQKIFSGGIIRVERSYTDGVETYHADCNDETFFLDRLIVVERFDNTTVEEIIAFIVDKYAPSFTYTNVNCTLDVASVTFGYLTVTDCLQKLSELTNYSWYVDYNRDIHFFAKNSEVAPFSLRDGYGNHIFDSLTFSDDITQLRNRVVVRGGEELDTERTESEFSTNGTRTLFPLSFKYQKKPVVTLDTVVQTVGVDYIDNPDNFDCLWSYNEKYLRFPDASAPANASVIEVTGKPLFPVLTQVSNPDSIAEFGVWEFYREDKTLTSRNQAIAYGLAELDAYSDTLIDGGFSTYRSGLKSGQALTIESTVRNIDEVVIVQRVSFSPMSDNRGVWNVEFATLKKIRMIQFLQARLLSERVEDGTTDGLLALSTFADSIGLTETASFIESTSPPYVYSPDNPVDENPALTYGKWGFATWG